MIKMSEQKVFDYKGKDIIEYTLSNGDVDIKVLNLGGAITGIFTKNKNGKKENIVVAYEDLETYIESPSYYGGIIGRTAGRINKGEVTINGEKITFNKNYEVCQCHGGNIGFNKKVWDAKTEIGKEKVSLILSYKSVDGEEGYPGNLDVNVIYSLNKENEFIIEFKGISDKDTLVNMTNHSYFNLSGDYKESVLDHKLMVTSNEILAIDNNSVPTGEVINTFNTAFDFREEKRIGKDIDNNEEQIKLGSGYDHTFLFNDKRNIVYKDDKSGREMQIETNNEAVVIYSMNFIDGKKVYGNKDIERRYGICFECQNPPIGYEDAFKESSILRAGEEYNKYIKYKFI